MQGDGNTKDTGRHAAAIIVEGEMVGQDASRTVGELRKKYKQGKPLEFVSDLSLNAGTNKVMIEELQIETIQGTLNHFSYLLRLREYAQIWSRI